MGSQAGKGKGVGRIAAVHILAFAMILPLINRAKAYELLTTANVVDEITNPGNSPQRDTLYQDYCPGTTTCSTGPVSGSITAFDGSTVSDTAGASISISLPTDFSKPAVDLGAGFLSIHLQAQGTDPCCGGTIPTAPNVVTNGAGASALFTGQITFKSPEAVQTGTYTYTLVEDVNTNVVNNADGSHFNFSNLGADASLILDAGIFNNYLSHIYINNYEHIPGYLGGISSSVSEDANASFGNPAYSSSGPSSTFFNPLYQLAESLSEGRNAFVAMWSFPGPAPDAGGTPSTTLALADLLSVILAKGDTSQTVTFDDPIAFGVFDPSGNVVPNVTATLDDGTILPTLEGPGSGYVPAQVPEPGSMGLLASGLSITALLARTRRKREVAQMR